jgi:hypothetical protein
MAGHRKRAAELSLSAINIEGALIAPAEIARILATPADQKTANDYGCPKGTSLKDEIARYFRIGQAHWQPFARIEQPTLQQVAEFARTQLEQVFGFEKLHGPIEHQRDGHRYRIAWEAKRGRVPIVCAAPVAPDDAFKRSLPEFGDGSIGPLARRTPTALLQEWLNANEGSLWGLVFAGDRLRLMRDNLSLTRPAWIEADLSAIYRDENFSEFTALWLLIHASRFGADGAAPGESSLEHWREGGLRAGTAVRDRLRGSVEEALELLGQGFLDTNPELRGRLASGELAMTEWFEQLLRLVYRLIFLAVAEDRDLLHGPDAKQDAKALYADNYGFGWLRDRSARQSGRDRHQDAYEGIKIVFEGLIHGEPVLGLTSLGGLFSAGLTPDLDKANLENRAFLAAVFRLAWLIGPQGRERINWRDMATEEFGSVYEGLLELVPVIEGGNTFGFAGSGEAKGNARKVSGSYYTPDSLVQTLLGSALDPVLERAEAEGGADAILNLKVIDPACGSGHFLLGSARRLANRIATLRDPNAPDYQAAMRDVVRNCIYGVDRNPLAVELAKVALWIEAIEPGKPLGFLDANIRCGDSLLGVLELKVLEEGIPDDAYQPLAGDDKPTAKGLKKLNMLERESKLLRLAIAPDKLASRFEQLHDMPESTVEDVRAKERAYRKIHGDPDWWSLRQACDAYVAAFLLAKHRPDGSFTAPLVPTTRQVREALDRRPPQGPGAVVISEAIREARAFHWPVEFPDVMVGRRGFDVVIGNPPFANAIENDLSEQRAATLRRFQHPDVTGAADYSYYFLSQADRLLRPFGLGGFVLPRVVLNAPAADGLRSRLNSDRPVQTIYACPDKSLFTGASVFVCLLCIGHGNKARVSASDLPELTWRTGQIENKNWWTAFLQIWEGRTVVRSLGPRAASYFDIHASMTTGDAYDIRPFIEEEGARAGLRLVTTGLIDPGICKWGQETCRYLKMDFERPIIADQQDLPKPLAAKIQKAKRPKILVAGLSVVPEAFLDDAGRYMGAVATYSIYHPQDNVELLQKLADYLNSGEVQQIFRDELGGNAISGGNITMRKPFLQDLALPFM